ncbi:MAG: tetratricopeptide repeat protein [Alphaproteobacteria bacterium]|nr:tetratricopeptide repeat protein [Alphaproteobacteria bacterium]
MALLNRAPQPSRITLADRARDAGEWETAAEHYRAALGRNPENPAIWVQYGHALKESGRLADAEAAYRRAIDEAPGIADSHVQLGHALKLQGRGEEARHTYLRALALDPACTAAQSELTQLGWTEQELDNARQTLRAEIGARQRRRRPSTITLADRARALCEWETAAQLYREALDRDPQRPEIWIQYGHMLKECGKLAEAASAYRQALARDGTMADAHLQLGHVLKLEGNTEAAQAAYLRAFALDPTRPDPIRELPALGWGETTLRELRGAIDPASLAPSLPSLNGSEIGPPAEASAPVPGYFLHRRGPLAALEQTSSTEIDRRSSGELLSKLEAVAYAQRWDIETLNEQLGATVRRAEQLEAALTARIADGETAREVEGRLRVLRARRSEAFLKSLGDLPGDGLNKPESVSDLVLIAESGLFDPAYYRAQRRPGDGPDGMAALVHYVRHGEAEGLAPHPLFQPGFYRKQLGTNAPTHGKLLLEYLKQPGDLAPNPLFSPAFYRKRYPEVEEARISPLSHYVLVGAAEGADPHPLFDTKYYCEQVCSRGTPRPDNALIQYLTSSRASISPHPLFDIEHYKRVSAEAAQFGEDAFLFYLIEGHRRGDPPHRLFDPGFYRAQAVRRGIDVIDPLAHFVEHGIQLSLSPHPLFDAPWYLARHPDVAASRANPLLHFLRHGDAEGRDPHPLFSTTYYKRKAGIGTEQNALIHYLDSGSEASDPYILFDTHFYLSQLGRPLSPGATPLTHYLTTAEGIEASPFPLFDQSYYCSQLAEPLPDHTPALLHYVQEPAEPPRSPHPLFDVQFFHEREGVGRPALIPFVEKFNIMVAEGYDFLHTRFTEANPYFCTISYLLDEPELRTKNTIPIIHYMQNAGSDAKWRSSGRSVRNRDEVERAPRDLAGYAPATYLPGVVAEIAREHLRQGARYLKADDRVFARTSDNPVMNMFAQVRPHATTTSNEPAFVSKLTASRRVAVYAVYLPNGRFRAYHRRVLAALREAGYTIVLVNSTFAGAGKLAAEARESAEMVMVRMGAGRDFASWMTALAHIGPALEHVDHLLLLNDSLIGPFADFTSLIASLEADPADFKGLTESFEREYHLQSSLLMLSRDALFSGAFLGFFGNFEPPASRDLTVSAGELGLSMAMTAARVVTRAMHPYPALVQRRRQELSKRLEWAQTLPARLTETGIIRVMRPEVASRFSAFLTAWLLEHSARLAQDLNFNSQHYFWDTLLGSGQYPFVKKDLLQKNPDHVPTLVMLCDFFAREEKHAAVELLRDIVPEACGMPPSYLHLSQPWVDAMLS